MKLDDLIDYFENEELPESIRIAPHLFVSDVRKMIDSNIAYLKGNPGNRRYLPYFDQLVRLKETIEHEKNQKKSEKIKNNFAGHFLICTFAM